MKYFHVFLSIGSFIILIWILNVNDEFFPGIINFFYFLCIRSTPFFLLQFWNCFDCFCVCNFFRGKPLPCDLIEIQLKSFFWNLYQVIYSHLSSLEGLFSGLLSLLSRLHYKSIDHPLFSYFFTYSLIVKACVDCDSLKPHISVCYFYRLPVLLSFLNERLLNVKS